MKRAITGCVVFGLLMVAGLVAQQQRPQDIELQKAIRTATVEGNLARAIEQYNAIVRKYGKSDRAVAAYALMAMAECYQKLGDAKAQQIYDRVVKEFADQQEAAGQARTRLTAMRAVSGTAPTSTRLAWRVNTNETDLDITSISLDGRLAIGTNYSSDPMDLAFRDMSSGRVTHLGAAITPFGLQAAGWPILSPDGQQVAFLWNEAVTARDWVAQLRVMPSTPGAKARVLMANPEVTYIIPSAWSPDGKRLLVAIQRLDETWQLAWVSATDGSTDILKSLDWRMRHSGGAVSLSPDGRHVAYCALAVNPAKPRGPLESTDTRIYVIAADGSTETVLTRTAGQNCSPMWSADGKHVLFLSNRSGSDGLWSVAVQDGRASGDPSLLKPDVGPINPVGVTRSGSYYYVTYTAVDRISIQTSSPSQGPDTLARLEDSITGINPSWSPDGKLLAFTRRSPNDRSDAHGAAGLFYDLVVHSLETGEERTYTCDGLLSGPPIWFPDGSRILVQAWPRQLRNVTPRQQSSYVVDLKTGKPQQILPAAGFMGFLPNGHDAYVTMSPDRIAIIDLRNGERKESFGLPKDPDTAFVRRSVTPSPKGRVLAIQAVNVDTGDAHLATATLGGDDYRVLHTVRSKPLPGGRRTNGMLLKWSADGRAIYFLEADSRGGNVMRIPAEGGPPEFSGFAPRNWTFSINPDNSRVAYSMRDGIMELWALELSSLLKAPR